MVVGEGPTRTFFIHGALLESESDRLAKDVSGGFKEETTRTIILNEEDPSLFGYFVEYLYETESRWLDDCTIPSPETYVISARLYVLGERLQAKRFQKAALRKFTKCFDEDLLIADQAACELLEIACTEIPERVKGDQLAEQIYWYAASRLDSLKHYDYFIKLLDTYKGLAKEMCLRASSGAERQPHPECPSSPTKFTPESIY